jgi:hypothetical protein
MPTIGRRIVIDTPMPAISGDASEVDSLAGELARAYRQMAAFYRDQLELTGPKADQRARGLDHSPDEAAADAARIWERPPDQVSWYDLNRLAERGPDAAVGAWKRVRAAARDELTSGHRTAQALEWQGRPWGRARFLAVRDSFRASTPPQSGFEAALMDTAAEAFSDYLEWSEHLHMQSSTEADTERNRLERDGYWSPPRLSMADAIDQSSRMAERVHTRFLRTVKALHEVRRLAATIYVGHAGQVNVGSQQVNIGPAPDDSRSE